jgi:putative acetyltransferase
MDHRWVKIRRERPTDHAAIREVHNSAFGPASGGDIAEAVLVDQLRASAWWLPRFSLVAVTEHGVVGHVVASRAILEPSDRPVLGLGPLGVIRGWQGRGVGSALMHAVLGAVEARDETLVGLLGEPRFYGRFGFRAGTDYAVAPPEPGWGKAFQVRILTGPPPTGTFRYAEPFERLG